MRHSRHVVGIDLGTTNTVAAWADTEAQPPSVRTLPIPQMVDWGASAPLDLLPSFAFFPPEAAVPPDGLRLPWGGCAHAVGAHARNSAAAFPGRVASSAKSWLCHPGVDRRGRILPWGAPEGAEFARSPVEVSALYLDHVRMAWNHAFAGIKDADGEDGRLERQQVVLTIPASFDETARGLTLEAARRCGLRDVVLVEEPLAAFHAWVQSVGEAWRSAMPPGSKALVVDVGGGTTDFSLIEMDASGSLSRTAAGPHLLLGGDNVDCAIARMAESAWGCRLGPREWAALVQSSREAKERILSSDAASAEVALLASGSAVVKGRRSFTLSRHKLMEVLLDGFFPAIPADVPPVAAKPGMRGMGLPYASEPAVTRHLLDFLRLAARLPPRSGESALLRPDMVLFNGGALIPPVLRQRVLDVLASWFPGAPPPVEMASPGFHHAVAIGAAAYGLSRRGFGVAVRGGTSRAFYVMAGTASAPTAVCVAPRGLEEGVRTSSGRRFRLSANQKVRFPLLCSSTRVGDKPGDAVPAGDGGLSLLCDLAAAIQFGKADGRELDATLAAELTETGLLKLWVETPATGHRWPLHFDLRAAAQEADSPAADAGDVVDAQAADAAWRAMDAALSAARADGAPPPLKAAESALGLPRERWPLPLLRHFADRLMAIGGAHRTAAAEARRLNALGYCLRPGFGDAADELRVKKLWRAWPEGPAHGNNTECVAEWWVLWRRVAPGLKPGHQRSVFQAAWTNVCPKGRYASTHKLGARVKAEAWRCLASLELLDTASKRQAAAILAARLDKLDDGELWVLARLASRRLFHAPADKVIPASDAAPWAEALCALAGRRPSPAVLFALSRVAALSGDRALDLPGGVVSAARAALASAGAPAAWLAHVDNAASESGEEAVRFLGDTLPLGLRLAAEPAAG